MDNRTLRPPAPARAPRRARPCARWILAGLLLAMAAGQLSDMAGFARIVADYRVVPDLLVDPAAWALAAGEATAGVLLLRDRRPGATLALAVAVMWTMLATQAFLRGLALENCGCFGVHFGQRLRWWVLLEDAEFIALALWVHRTERPNTPVEDLVGDAATGQNST